MKRFIFPTLILAPAYLMVIVFIFWQYIETGPLTHRAFGPFTDHPVMSLAEANANKITAAKPETDVYLFESWCLKTPTRGTVSQTWVDGLVYRIPDRQTFGMVGCHEKSFKVRTPPATVAKDFFYRKSITYSLNPIRSDVVYYPEVPLRIVP